LHYVHVRDLRLVLYTFIDELHELAGEGLDEPECVKVRAILQNMLDQYVQHAGSAIARPDEPMLQTIASHYTKWNLTRLPRERNSHAREMRKARREMAHRYIAPATDTSRPQLEFYRACFEILSEFENVRRPKERVVEFIFSNKERRYFVRYGVYRPRPTPASLKLSHAFPRTARLAREKLARCS
jgi:hypothetical protein